VLRFLLKHYKDAAKIKDASGVTAYDLLPKEIDTEPLQRLLLRAVPKRRPSELRRLNYEARRGALYLLFAAELPGSEVGMELEQEQQGQMHRSGSGRSSSSVISTAGTMTAAGSRRPTRKNAAAAAATNITKLSAEPAGDHDASVNDEEILASSTIWRLLKSRADLMLCRSIVLYL
jgi:hypothetical protein